MQIQVENLGKKFSKDWIFRGLNLTLHQGETYTVTGANGSGKSTLLQIIAGMQPSSEGKITYQHQQNILNPDNLFRQLAMAAPYLELVEEFTLTELIQFHVKFKSFRDGLSVTDFLEKIHLAKARNKFIRHFSSGMKQRLKLGLAFYSDTPLLLLDEPTSNLDATGIAWYQESIRENLSGRLLIICSNQPYEYEFCENILHIQDGRIRQIY